MAGVNSPAFLLYLKGFKMTKILFIGDIIGKIGRKAVRQVVPILKKVHEPDFIIANCENLAHGFGITSSSISEMVSAGVNCFTSGNHIYDKNDAYSILEDNKDVLRPLNYPPNNPGNGFVKYDLPGNISLLVINVMGRAFMPPSDCPFRTVDRLLERESGDIIFIDFHGEATAEKICFGNYFDGRVTAVVGTHTHTQTADEKTLEKGTAFICDAGMTGAYNSIIGVEKETAIKRMLSGINLRFEPAKGEFIFNGVLIETDKGKNNKITRINILEKELNNYGT